MCEWVCVGVPTQFSCTQLCLLLQVQAVRPVKGVSVIYSVQLGLCLNYGIVLNISFISALYIYFPSLADLLISIFHCYSAVIQYTASI